MKKVICFLLITILLLTGCEKKNNDIKIEEAKPIVEKIDSEKEYVYFQTLQPIVCQTCEGYDLQYAVINLNSEEVATVNLEIKNFVTSSYRNMLLEETTLLQGRLFHYDVILTDSYITLIQDYAFYLNSSFTDSNSRIYVVNKNTGKLLSNEDLLKEKEMTEEDLFSFIEQKKEVEDPLFLLSVLKNEGYQFYLNQNKELVLRFYEQDNIGVTKREFTIK